MLPPGHIAAGYLTSYALLKFTKPALDIHQQTALLWWGALFGFAPDVDMFFAFFRQKTFLVIDNKHINHRKFYSHAPVLWLIAGLLIYFLGPSLYIKYIGLLLWLGSWSHFLLDSIEDGIMWLWPLNSKLYAFKQDKTRLTIPEKNFFKHTWQFLKLYSTRLTFYFEVIIILSALIIYFR